MLILSQVSSLLLPVISLFYLFAGTGIAAYDFLCPNLHLLSIHSGLSEAVIGATFIAFGNTSGDIFSSFVAFRHGNPSLAFGSIVGAALFIICVVIGALAFFHSGEIDSRVFIRDASFLMVAVSAVIYIVSDGKITIHESVALVALYVVYATVLIKSESYFHEEPEFSHSNYMHLHPDLDDGPIRPSFVEAVEHFRDHPDSDNGDNSSSLGAHTMVYRDSPSPAISPLSSPVPSSSKGGDRVLQIPRIDLSSACDDTPPVSPIGKRSRSLSIRSGISDVHDFDRPTSILEHVLPLFPHWDEFSISLKIFNVLMWPMLALLQLSIPISQSREGKTPKNLMSVYAITTPIAIYLLALPHDSITMAATGISSIVLLLMSRWLQVSILVPAFVGFGVSVVWILFLATNMVDIVKYIGSLLNIPKAVLGLTVVAIGNSLGDLVSNISIARSDHSKMALSACFGSPLLLIMMGLGGSPLVVMLLEQKTSIPIPQSNSVITSCVLLLLTLLMLAIVLPLSKWKMSKVTGGLCIGLWVVNTVLNLTIYS